MSTTSMFNSASLDRDTSLDANVLLAELDKGLRSIRPGEQCEAIVRFPWVFERYPFPILINSACLKLSEVFKNGSNFCKLLILRVIQESVNHLDKISNSEEFIRRIFSVSYSNDPVARAITLQVLAAISPIAFDRKDIHHCIRGSLDSNDEVEVSAAIEAAASFANKSLDFALNIYPKVLSKIKRCETPVETKIQLMTVLRHPHYDSELAIQVREECESLLLVHPSFKFIRVTLNTLTYISSASLTCVPLQINLLLLYWNEDSRYGIKECVMKDLKSLARSSPHLWSKRNVEQLMDAIMVMKDKCLGSMVMKDKCLGSMVMKDKCLGSKSLKDDLLLKDDFLPKDDLLFHGLIQVLELLFRCPSLLQGDMSIISRLNNATEGICVRVIQSGFNFRTTALCFQILTSICITSNRHETVDVTILAYQTYLFARKTDSHLEVAGEEIRCRRSVFRNLVRLCKSNEQVKEKLTLSLRSIIGAKDASQSKSFRTKDASQSKSQSFRTKDASQSQSFRTKDASQSQSQSWIGMIAETLCAVESSSEECEELYERVVEVLESSEDLKDEIRTKLFTLAFQSCLIAGMSCDVSLADQMEGMDCWNMYRILRQAMRFGHFGIGNILADRLKNSVSSEFIFFWMLSLEKMCIAEGSLSNSDVLFNNRVSKAISAYVECITAMKGVVSPLNPFQFQLEYLNLRLRTLQTHEAFRLSCNMVRTAPAPAIAAAIASATRDDLLRCGTVVTQMRKCAKELRSLSDSYSSLFQSSFNADHQTLAHLQLLQSSCTIIAEAIESIFQTNRVSSLFVDQHTHLENSRLDGDKDPTCEHRQLIKVCHRISSLVQRELATRSSSNLDANQIHLLNSISEHVLSVPLRVPRLFFQSVQMINVKLAVSPMPKVAGEPILLPPHNSLALKVEGVIVASQKTRSETRRVSKVSLNVSSSPILKNGEFGHFGKAGELNMNCLVAPYKDYFQSQFLLTLPTSGLHSVTVEAAIIDENDAQWKTGPIVQFNVKLLEEAMLR